MLSERPDFRALFESELPWMLSTLRRFGVGPGDVPDVAQEVFVTVHSILDDFDAARPVRPWLFGIAYRVASRHRALARHSRELATDVPEEPDPRPLPDEVMATTQRQTLVREAIATMDLSRRAVFLLVDLEGASAPEAAEALGIPLNTVYSRLRRAREDFAQAVERLQHRRPS